MTPTEFTLYANKNIELVQPIPSVNLQFKILQTSKTTEINILYVFCAGLEQVLNWLLVGKCVTLHELFGGKISAEVHNLGVKF